MIEWSNHAHALVSKPKLCEFRLPGRPRRTKEGVLKVRTQRAVEGKADLPRRLLDATVDCCWTVRNFLTHRCKSRVATTILELD